MTNKEAIIVLKNIAWFGKIYDQEQTEEAVDMAINALTAQEQLANDSPEVDNKFGDLISRQAANAAICNACGKIDCDQMDTCGKIDIPPINSSEIPNSSDTISRQEAIEAVEFGITYAKAINKSTGEVKELFKEGNKALNEAVERLKELPSAEPEKTQLSEEDATSDCISRKAAINVLEERLQANGYSNVALVSEFNRSIGYLMRLPSAQPETHKERTETHACDCIERQAAIRWVKTECNPYGNPTIDFESGKKVIKHLEQMPSAQPQRTGRWIEQDDSWDGVYYECSACGEPWTMIDGTPWDNGMKFCPNCGAEMEGQYE